MKKKVYAFIDSQNLNLGIQKLGWKLDFARFRVYLRDKYNVSKAFLFIGYVLGNEALYIRLAESGYIVVFKPTLTFGHRRKIKTKGNVDAELVLWAALELNNYDKAIIVSGDGDFYCLVRLLREKNKLLHIMIPNPNRYSALLREFREYFAYLNRLKKKLGYKKSERE